MELSGFLRLIDVRDSSQARRPPLRWGLRWRGSDAAGVEDRDVSPPIVRRRSPIDWLIVLRGEPRDGRADGGCGRCFFFIRERLYQTGGVITADSDLIEMSGLMGL